MQLPNADNDVHKLDLALTHQSSTGIQGASEPRLTVERDWLMLAPDQLTDSFLDPCQGPLEIWTLKTSSPARRCSVSICLLPWYRLVSTRLIIHFRRFHTASQMLRNICSVDVSTECRAPTRSSCTVKLEATHARSSESSMVSGRNQVSKVTKLITPTTTHNAFK